MVSALAVSFCVVLAGCSTGSHPNTSGSSAGTVGGGVTASSADGAPTSSAEGSSSVGGVGTTSSPASTASSVPAVAPGPATSVSAAPASPAGCASADLAVSLAAGGGGGAGNLLPYLVLTNKGSTACTMRGYPGVSFVGDNNGTQLGAAGLQVDQSSVQTVTLAPNGSAHSQLRIVQAANFPSDKCQPVTADGLRVYPPNQTAALFVATKDYTACSNTALAIISVGPMEPGD